MAAPPTRSGGASLPRPEASADAASLRAYLAKDTHARVSRLSADDFTSWLERETLERLHRDRPAALRARADATRRFHRRTIFPLEAAVAAADAAFDASDDRARIAAAEKAVAQARAAIEGITAHLAREDAVSEPGTGFFTTERGGAGDATDDRKYETDETKAREAEKRAATVARLDAARASLPGLRSAHEACLSASRLYREREAARAALRDGRARTGLDAAESEAGSAERGAGAESGALGAAFEEAGLRAVARLIREGRFEVPGMRDEPRGSGEDALFMLRNMSLGMGLGEIDGALVRVRDDEKGVAHTAFSPSRSVAYGRRRRRSGFPETDDAPPDCNPKPPNVEVLAVFECKRNPDDARRGFLRRRADLGWLAGESPRDASDETSARPAYDPKRYVNRNHPTGHFVRGYHPVRRMERVTPVAGSDILRSDVTDADGDETEETANDGSAEASEPSESRFLVVTKASFRRFANGFANGGAGFYFPRLCLVTRPRTMCGLDTKVRAVIESSFESSFEKLRPSGRKTRRTSLFFFFFFPRAPNRRTYLGGASRGSLGILLGERLLHSSAENHQGYAATNSRGSTLARSTFSRPTRTRAARFFFTVC